MKVVIRPARKESYAEARAMAKELGDRHLRAPHHTVTMAGISGEVAIAAGGVLLLDDVESFPSSSLRAVRNLVNHMHEDVRPVLFLTYFGPEMSARVANVLGLEDEDAEG